MIFSDRNFLKKLHTDEGLVDYLASMVYDETRRPGQASFDSDGFADSEDALGLTRVIDFIAELKKPLIVHNGAMDLMFLYHHFFGPLPEDVNVFKSEINRLFPFIHDTRHLLNTRMQLRKLLTGSFADLS